MSKEILPGLDFVEQNPELIIFGVPQQLLDRLTLLDRKCLVIEMPELPRYSTVIFSNPNLRNKANKILDRANHNDFW